MKEILLPGFVSLITSLLVTFVGTKLAFQQKISEQLYNQREEIYSELFSLLNKLARNPSLIYNYEEVVGPLDELRVKLNFYSSKRVVINFRPLCRKIMLTYDNYQAYLAYHEQSDDVRIERGDANEWELEQEICLWEETHLIDERYLTNQIELLVDLMRKDLKRGK